MRNEYATSDAVTARPSWNRTPSRIRIVHTLASAFGSTDSASDKTTRSPSRRTNWS